MSKRLFSRGFLCFLLVGATALLTRPVAGTAPSASADLTVHEWGTFTSVAGPDGQAMDWQPLSGPQDLPCFVTKLNPGSVKVISPGAAGGLRSAIKARVRMETPVLYFYTPRETTVRVKVRFPQGLISEWYPQASVPATVMPPNFTNAVGSIEWSDVKITPGSSPGFPTESGKSHYYAARETDSAPVQVGSQTEKFLFYRGLASFPVPMSARVADDGRIAIENSSTHEIATAILFENNGRKTGYRVVRGLRDGVVLERPKLSSSVESVRSDLERTLIEEGLYPREARAMIATWRDSWFEEGTRLFYIVPREALASILPLEIEPRPAQVARVFVGRLEIVTPDIQNDVEHAILTNDLDTLNKYGRFLEPIAQGILSRPSLAASPSRVSSALQAIGSSATRTAACQ
jgi:hypothetical protein